MEWELSLRAPVRRLAPDARVKIVASQVIGRVWQDQGADVAVLFAHVPHPVLFARDQVVAIDD